MRQHFLDVESLVFWPKAVSLPEDFDMERHWKVVNRSIADDSKPLITLKQE